MLTIPNVWYLKDLLNEKSKQPIMEYHNFLTNDEISFIIDKADKHAEQGEVWDSESKTYIVNNKFRNSPISWLNPDDEEVEHIFRKLTDIVTQVNIMHYDFTLSFIEPLQYTKYIGNKTKPGFYDRHVDGSSLKSGFMDRKLSFSILLNNPDEFEGGDLITYTEMQDEYKPDIKKGSIVFFPSYMLHEVTPVTSGIRQSLVGWVNGPEFK